MVLILYEYTKISKMVKSSQRNNNSFIKYDNKNIKQLVKVKQKLFPLKKIQYTTNDSYPKWTIPKINRYEASKTDT